GLDAVDGQLGQLLGDLYLGLGVEVDPWGLLPVTQGGVKDDDLLGHGRRPPCGLRLPSVSSCPPRGSPWGGRGWAAHRRRGGEGRGRPGGRGACVPAPL